MDPQHPNRRGNRRPRGARSNDYAAAPRPLLDIEVDGSENQYGGSPDRGSNRDRSSRNERRFPPRDFQPSQQDWPHHEVEQSHRGWDQPADGNWSQESHPRDSNWSQESHPRRDHSVDSNWSQDSHPRSDQPYRRDRPHQSPGSDRSSSRGRHAPTDRHNRDRPPYDDRSFDRSLNNENGSLFKKPMPSRPSLFKGKLKSSATTNPFNYEDSFFENDSPQVDHTPLATVNPFRANSESENKHNPLFSGVSPKIKYGSSASQNPFSDRLKSNSTESTSLFGGAVQKIDMFAPITDATGRKSVSLFGGTASESNSVDPKSISLFGGTASESKPVDTNSISLFAATTSESNPLDSKSISLFGGTTSEFNPLAPKSTSLFGGTTSESNPLDPKSISLFGGIDTLSEVVKERETSDIIKAPTDNGLIFGGESSKIENKSINIFGGKVDQKEISFGVPDSSPDAYNISKNSMKEKLDDSQISSLSNNPVSEFSMASENKPTIDIDLTGSTSSLGLNFSEIDNSINKSDDRRLDSKTVDDLLRVSDTQSDAVDINIETIEPTDIIVANIHEDYYHSEILKNHFSKFGTISRLSMHRKSNQTRVSYTTHESAAMAKKHGKVLHDNIPHVIILFYTSKNKKKSSKKDKKSSKNDPADDIKKKDVSDDISVQLKSIVAEHEKKRERRKSELSSEGHVLEKWIKPKNSNDNVFTGRNIKLRRNIPDKLVNSKPKTNERKNLDTTKSVPVDKFKLNHNLTSLCKIKIQTNQDKYDILKKRDEFLRKLVVKVSDVSSSKYLSAACPDMCPEKERYMREVQNDLSSYEMAAEKKVNHKKAIKKFSRSSAAKDEPLPHELRNGPVLAMTLDYILCNIVPDLENHVNSNLDLCYNFIWDRTRAIRSDITQQHLQSKEAVRVLEICVRFHIFCAERLCEETPDVFDPKMNTEHLSKCMLSLKDMYHDMAQSETYFETEAEFRGYEILYNLDDGNIIVSYDMFRDCVRVSPAVQFGIDVLHAYQTKNYVKFFKLFKKSSFLQACIMHKYVDIVRETALEVIIKALSRPGQPQTMKVDKLTELLQFEDRHHTVSFLKSYNLSIVGTEVPFDRSSFKYPSERIPSKRSLKIISSKRRCDVSAALNNGIVPVSPSLFYKPHNSFSDDGYLVITDAATLDNSLNEEDEKPAVAIEGSDSASKLSTANKIPAPLESDKEMHDAKPEETADYDYEEGEYFEGEKNNENYEDKYNDGDQYNEGDGYQFQDGEGEKYNENQHGDDNYYEGSSNKYDESVDYHNSSAISTNKPARTADIYDEELPPPKIKRRTADIYDEELPRKSRRRTADIYNEELPPKSKRGPADISKDDSDSINGKDSGYSSAVVDLIKKQRVMCMKNHFKAWRISVQQSNDQFSKVVCDVRTEVLENLRKQCSLKKRHDSFVRVLDLNLQRKYFLIMRQRASEMSEARMFRKKTVMVKVWAKWRSFISKRRELKRLKLYVNTRMLDLLVLKCAQIWYKRYRLSKKIKIANEKKIVSFIRVHFSAWRELAKKKAWDEKKLGEGFPAGTSILTLHEQNLLWGSILGCTKRSYEDVYDLEQTIAKRSHAESVDLCYKTFEMFPVLDLEIYLQKVINQNKPLINFTHGVTFILSICFDPALSNNTKSWVRELFFCNTSQKVELEFTLVLTNDMEFDVRILEFGIEEAPQIEGLCAILLISPENTFDRKTECILKALNVVTKVFVEDDFNKPQTVLNLRECIMDIFEKSLPRFSLTAGYLERLVTDQIAKHFLGVINGLASNVCLLPIAYCDLYERCLRHVELLVTCHRGHQWSSPYTNESWFLDEYLCNAVTQALASCMIKTPCLPGKVK